MTRTEKTFWALAAIIIVLGFLALSATGSKATDFDWSMSGDGYHSHKPRKAKRRYRAPEYRYYASPVPPPEDWRCLDTVRVVGSQWVAEEGAEDSAKKAFMEEVRWRHGESFMSIDNARDYEKRCSRSSVGEAVGQTLVRCEIAARPCRPPMKIGTGK
jgi:hypothetical protein